VQDRRSGFSARLLIVEVSWGWCGLRRSEAGLTRSTLPQSTRDAASKLVAACGQAPSSAPAWDDRDALLCEAGELLKSYFAGERPDFALPLDLSGLRRFSRDVLRACARIPRGETRSYGEVAAMAGAPRAARAAGQALARNPLPIFVPCHRVIGADGKLAGFGGGLEMKRRLLALEESGGQSSRQAG